MQSEQTYRSMARKATKGGFGNRQVQKGDELVFDRDQIK
jgi:hypothetical protein